MQILYYTLGALAFIAAGLAGVLKIGKRIGSAFTTLDVIAEDVREIKLNHIPHLDARIQSIEEYLRR